MTAARVHSGISHLTAMADTFDLSPIYKIKRLYQEEFDAMEQRALKAENAFLTLDCKTRKEKLELEKNLLEEAMLNKIKLYTDSDTLGRIRQDFQQALQRISTKLGKLDEILNLSKECLGKGLSLDELPKFDDDSPIDKIKLDLEPKIQQKLVKKNQFTYDLEHVYNQHYAMKAYQNFPQSDSPSSYSGGQQTKVSETFSSMKISEPVDRKTNSLFHKPLETSGLMVVPEQNKQDSQMSLKEILSTGSNNTSLRPASSLSTGLEILSTGSNNTSLRPASSLPPGLEILSTGSNNSSSRPASSLPPGLATYSQAAASNVVLANGGQKSSANHNPGNEVRNVMDDLDHFVDSTDGDEQISENNIAESSNSDSQHHPVDEGPDESWSVVKPKDPRKPVRSVINWKKSPFSDIVVEYASTKGVSKEIAEKALELAYQEIGSLEHLDKLINTANKHLPQPRRMQQNAPVTKPVTGNSKPISIVPPATVPPSTVAHSNFKTALCKNWSASRTCPYGETCNFAHGTGELRNFAAPQTFTLSPASSTTSLNSATTYFYKVILCKNYGPGKTCNWGDRCIFAHGQHELRTGHSLEEDGNESHDEPCENQQCPARLNFLLKKTSMCDKYQKGQCIFGSNCKFAHGKNELLPMPKYEMCQRHAEGRCKHMDCPEKCVYAHSSYELRQKPFDLLSYEKINQKKKSPIKPSAGQMLLGKGDAAQGSEDECLICMHPIQHRKKVLKCGHDSFHEECISRWVNEGYPSCPVCRAHAVLPDKFKAPAGLMPADFPPLPL